ncbi:MAG: hypothetical protein IT379_22780 [Deltaproteobacteria bacterium]|nr:hypothetical protein [Deltaproteobacteria bacterium]
MRRRRARRGRHLHGWIARDAAAGALLRDDPERARTALCVAAGTTQRTFVLDDLTDNLVVATRAYPSPTLVRTLGLVVRARGARTGDAARVLVRHDALESAAASRDPGSWTALGSADVPGPWPAYAELALGRVGEAVESGALLRTERAHGHGAATPHVLGAMSRGDRKEGVRALVELQHRASLTVATRAACVLAAWSRAPAPAFHWRGDPALECDLLATHGAGDAVLDELSTGADVRMRRIATLLAAERDPARARAYSDGAWQAVAPAALVLAPESVAARLDLWLALERRVLDRLARIAEPPPHARALRMELAERAAAFESLAGRHDQAVRFADRALIDALLLPDLLLAGPTASESVEPAPMWHPADRAAAFRTVVRARAGDPGVPATLERIADPRLRADVERATTAARTNALDAEQAEALLRRIDGTPWSPSHAARFVAAARRGDGHEIARLLSNEGSLRSLAALELVVPRIRTGREALRDALPFAASTPEPDAGLPALLADRASRLAIARALGDDDYVARRGRAPTVLRDLLLQPAQALPLALLAGGALTDG